MNKAKELDRLDKKIARTKELQKELDHRKEVEDKVFRLFSEGKFEEGKALLDPGKQRQQLFLLTGRARDTKEKQRQQLKTTQRTHWHLRSQRQR